MSSSSVASKLQTCLPSVLSHYPVVAAYLFGSAAAGRATDLSDIDIALVLEQAQFLSSDRLEMELEIEDQIVRVCEIAKADV